MICKKWKGVMNYHNANKYVSSARADVETTLLLYLHFFCVRIFLSECLRYAWVHPRECRYTEAV